MPAASDHECPDKGSPASKTSCTSEVLRQLELLATNARLSQKLRFPDPLVEALLRIEPSVNTPNLDAIRSIIEPNWKKTLLSLDNNSLRCLSYVLICSSAPVEQESGLYLLLDGNQHLRSAKPEGSGPKLLRSRSKSLSLQDRLVSILHPFFINDGNDIEHRRLAGKLLLELLLESKDRLSSGIFHIQELINDASGVLYCETDVILRFFAGAIIRILRLFGVANSFGAPENVTDGSAELEGLGQSTEDWNGYFHLYTPETEPEHTGEMSKATQPKTDLMTSYHTIQELRICGREHIREAILTALTPDALIFILLLGTGPEQFQYIEIPLWCISKRKTPALKKAENQKSQLRVHLDMESHVLIDGRAHPSNESDVYIASENDLTALWKTLDTGRKKGLQKSKNKRIPKGKISSIIVTLCTGDEISRKSIQYCEKIRQEEGSSSENSSLSVPGTIKNISENTETGIESKKVDNEPGLTCEKPADDGDLAKGGQGDAEVIQESEKAPKQLSVNKDVSEPSCNSRGSKRNSPQKDSPYASNASMSAEKARNDAPVSDATNLASVIQMQHSSLSDTTGGNDKAGANSEKGPFAHRNVESVQRKSSGNHPRTIKSSTKTKGRARLLDTQESLIFPRSRRLKRKVYTVHSKPAVDWDEHLRPSDEGDDMPAPKDPEVTSVSSPSPGESSIFDKSSKNTTKKRKAKGCQSAEKGKRPIKKKKANCSPRSEEAGRSPLVSTGANTRNTRNKIRMGEAKDDKENDLVMTYGDTHESDRDYEMDDAELSLEYAPHVVFLNDDSASVLKEDNPPFLRETRRDFPNSGSEENRTSNGHRRSKRLKGDNESYWGMEDQLRTYTKTQAQEDAKTGRGQTVGEKLAAALCEGNVRPDPQTVHGHNGDDSPLVCEMPQERIPRPTSSIEDGTCFAGNKCGDKLVEDNGDHDTSRKKLDLKENVEFPAIPETTVCAVSRDLTYEKTASKPSDEKSKNDTQVTEFERISTKNNSRTTSPDSMDEPGEIQTMSTAPLTQNQSQPKIIAHPRHSSDASNRSPKSHKTTDTREANDKNSIFGLSNNENQYLALNPENTLVEYDHEEPDSEKATVICLSKASQDESASISRSSQSSPKITLVDENGSPRRISRQYIRYQSSSELETELRQPTQLDKSLRRDVIEQGSSESGYDGDSDGNYTDESPMTRDVSTFRRNIVSYFGEESLGSRKSRILLTGNRDMPHTAFSKMKRSPRFVGRLRAPTEIPNMPQATTKELGSNIGDENPKRPATVPNQFPSMKCQDPVQLDHGMKEMSKPAREKQYQGEWHSSLQMIQKSAQDIMNQTNEHLIRHAEDEKNTVSQVLENYREGCHRVLDQLFEAQEQRIELYRQQMITVKQHHAGLCRDLIRRLEENHKRIQEKVLHMENSMISLGGGNEPQSSAEGLLGSYRRKLYTTANGNSHSSHSLSDSFDESSSISGWHF